MNFSKYILISFLATSLLACSNGIDTDATVFDFDHKDNQKVIPTSPKDLGGLSATKLIETKYETFKLNCKMWTQKGLGLNTDVTPNASFNYDVLEVKKQSAQLILQSVIENYHVDVKIEIEDIFHLPAYSLKTKDKFQYNLTHTPEVTLSYSYIGKTLNGNQVSVNSTHEGRLPLLEKVNYHLVKHVYNPTNNKDLKFLTQVDCLIVSKIKAPYENQFEKKAIPNK